MPVNVAPSGLAITDPLVLYRALVAGGRIVADPAQHRLALHLQKLYQRLKDYEPTVDYQQKLTQISRTIGDNGAIPKEASSIGTRGIWSSLLAQKEKRDSLALTRVLTDREVARKLESPKGLMLHGEVGTGKSMLVDLFADCLPTRKKRRWHFNTFMLETFARLEQLRKRRLRSDEEASDSGYEHSLLWLAKDLIQESPILFLDEFQLPDRAASKIMSNVMTSFFQLGGVLIATSNRMPDELAKAAGIQFATPPSRSKSLVHRLGLGTSVGKSEGLFGGGHGEFADFLDLLKARCDVWEMEGRQDYRRLGDETPRPVAEQDQDAPSAMEKGTAVFESTSETSRDAEEPSSTAPAKYFVRPSDVNSQDLQAFAERFAVEQREALALSPGLDKDQIPWMPSTLLVYGRTVDVPRQYNGVTAWTFDELCGSRLGSADYVTIASTFHTVVLSDVPILTSLQKNEARRFITLLDALYESRCKLLITAEAAPDELFFPEQRTSKSSVANNAVLETQSDDATYAETFSEAYQDATAPFRPNISTYGDGPDYTHARLQGILAPDALEDDPPNKLRREGLSMKWSRGSSFLEGDHEHFDMQSRRGPDFGRTQTFIGEDEKFAYKRARSRLWEMCGTKWWARQDEGWWRPVPVEVRRWERRAADEANRATQPEPNMTSEQRSEDPIEGMGHSRAVDQANDKLLYEHKANPLSASPFRERSEPPPVISWAHVWGTVRWGKKAGAWGQGPEGLKDRKKDNASLDARSER